MPLAQGSRTVLLGVETDEDEMKASGEMSETSRCLPQAYSGRRVTAPSLGSAEGSRKSVVSGVSVLLGPQSSDFSL